jgi:hypothetical protein
VQTDCISALTKNRYLKDIFVKLLQLFKRLTLGLLMALAACSSVQAGEAAFRGNGMLPTFGTKAKTNKLTVMTAANARATAVSDSQTYPLTPVVTENGYINLSLDALGTENPGGGTIQVNKPKNATVRGAYLVGASDCMEKSVGSDVSINGSHVVWQRIIPNSILFWNYWADVTSLVKAKIDSSAAGLVDIVVVEKEPNKMDGEILAVIFDDPNQKARNTVVLFFGAQNIAGDNFYIKYAEPVNLSAPNLRLDFSLGISFSIQYDGNPQYSIIDVNGKRLSSAAGGEDDGFSGAGGLITVGGIGDSDNNPVNPLDTPSNCRSDDELYSLIPFVSQGETRTHIFTENPSNNDNICFAALFTSITSIVGDGILLTPVADTNMVGTMDTLTAKAQNNSGAPMTGQKVIFEIVKGPDVGLKDSSVTDGSGNALFIYNGLTVGQDEIVATMSDGTAGLVYSNHAYHVWKRAGSTSPIANAGPDQTVPAGALRDTAIALNGSGSYDPDGGSIVSYTWLLPVGGTLTGAKTTIRLSAGTYPIVLTVVDDEGGSGKDTVIITVIDTTHTSMPVINQAAFFADNGRGSVNRVDVYYNTALDTAEVPDSIRICWPDSSDCRMIRKDNITQDHSNLAHLTITIPVPAFPDGITRYTGNSGNLGRTYWKGTSKPDSRIVESPFAISDSVGPLIMSASAVERIKNGVDTIYVSFSETINPQTIVGPSLILIKSGVPSVIVVDTFRQLSDSVYVISLDTGSAQPKPGDSLRINPAGPLRDKFGNPAHALNRPVLLGTKGIPPSILSAYYFDRDSGRADGIVDEAIIRFDKKADTAGLSLLFDWGSSVPLSTIQGADIAYLSADSTLISVNLKNAFPDRPHPKTSGVMYVTSQWKQWKKVPWQTDNAKVQDSAAPVISSASYLLGGEADGVCDTLVVFFSEPVTIKPGQNARPFKFFNGSIGSTYILSVSLIKQQSNDTMARFCVSSDLITDMPKTGDSIWINPAGGVSDSNGIAQMNERNRKVALKVSRPNSEFFVKVFPNPFTPGTVIPETGFKGAAIVVSPINTKAKLQEMTGSVRIFDLLGNLIFEGNLVKQTFSPPLNTCYYLVWEGYNRKNRIVGTGVYPMTVTYTIEGEKPVTKWRWIGVKQ